MSWLRRNWPILLLALFPLIPLWRAVFLGETIGPFDQIRQMAPWSEPPPERPWDVLQADGALQFYAWRDLVLESWQRGELPLWNPYQLAGTPLLANSQSGGFYPPHILLGLLHVPTGLAMTLLAWFHLAWAGFGLMALARRLGASRGGAAVGGVLFSGSAFMISWTALPSVISTCAWIPWVLAGTLAIFDREGARSKIGTAVGLAFAFAMMVLAGHLQFAFYGFLAAFLVAIVRWAYDFFGRIETEQAGEPEKAPKGPRQLKRANAEASISTPSKAAKPKRGGTFAAVLVGAAALVGVGLSAPQLMPVLENSKDSHRRNVPSAEGYEAYVAGAVAPFELAGLVYPASMGLPFEHAPEDRPLSQYWPQMVKRGANFAEGALGFGPLAFLGLLLFPWRRSAAWRWLPVAGLGAFAALIALGTPLNRLLYFGIPGWSATGSPGRMGVLFVMAACAMAAVGFSRVNWGEYGNRRWAVAAFGLGGATLATILALIALGGNLQPRFEGMDPALIKRLVSLAITGSLTPTLLAVGLAIYGYMLLQSRKAEPNRAPWVVGGLVGAMAVAALAKVVLFAIPTSSSVFPRTEEVKMSTIDRITGINDPWELVIAAPAVLPPNTAAAMRVHDIAGYDSLLNRKTHELLALINGQDPAPPANGNIQFIKPTADPAKLAAAGVGYVLARAPVFPGLQPTTTPSGLLCYKLEGPGRAYTYAGPARIVDGFDRQTVHAIGPGQLTIKDRNMEGWKAYVNGRQRPIAPGIWRVLELPEGEHQIDFVYDPPGLRAGFLVFLPSLLLAGLGGLFGRERK